MPGPLDQAFLLFHALVPAGSGVISYGTLDAPSGGVPQRALTASHQLSLIEHPAPPCRCQAFVLSCPPRPKKERSGVVLGLTPTPIRFKAASVSGHRARPLPKQTNGQFEVNIKE
jgi:hypothetical protein